MNKQISRRRFISITAVAGIAAALPLPLLANVNKYKNLHHWRGFAMGADASIKLYSNSQQKSESLTKLCLEEIIRLEKLFSLYEQNSTINQLNRSGKINNPPAEFRELLTKAQHYSELTGGYFDITVQTLWKNPTDTKLVGYKNIVIEDNAITFKRKNMSMTLNGIAQGYITDKVTELLNNNGIGNVLVDMGETRASGTHKDGRLWQIGIRDSEEILGLKNMAIATSGNNGAIDNHIFNPLTGKTTHKYKSVSVIAPSAAAADALSTAVYIMPYKKVIPLIKSLNNVQALIINNREDIIRVS